MAKKKAKREKYEVGPAPKGWLYGWRARRVGRMGVELGQFSRKSEAVRYVANHAKSRAPSQLFIKGRNGKIQDERTYGDDPRRTKG